MNVQNRGMTIRSVREDDSFERLTEILRAADGRLAAMGLNYKAVDQPVEVTRERASLGECCFHHADWPHTNHKSLILSKVL